MLSTPETPWGESMELCQNCGLTEFDCLCGEVDHFFNDIRQMADREIEDNGSKQSKLACGACECCPCVCDEY